MAETFQVTQSVPVCRRRPHVLDCRCFLCDSNVSVSNVHSAKRLWPRRSVVLLRNKERLRTN